MPVVGMRSIDILRKQGVEPPGNRTPQTVPDIHRMPGNPRRRREVLHLVGDGEHVTGGSDERIEGGVDFAGPLAPPPCESAEAVLVLSPLLLALPALVLLAAKF